MYKFLVLLGKSRKNRKIKEVRSVIKRLQFLRCTKLSLFETSVNASGCFMNSDCNFFHMCGRFFSLAENEVF